MDKEAMEKVDTEIARLTKICEECKHKGDCGYCKIVTQLSWCSLRKRLYSGEYEYLGGGMTRRKGEES